MFKKTNLKKISGIIDRAGVTSYLYISDETFLVLQLVGSKVIYTGKTTLQSALARPGDSVEFEVNENTGNIVAGSFKLTDPSIMPALVIDAKPKKIFLSPKQTVKLNLPTNFFDFWLMISFMAVFYGNSENTDLINFATLGGFSDYFGLIGCLLGLMSIGSTVIKLAMTNLTEFETVILASRLVLCGAALITLSASLIKVFGLQSGLPMLDYLYSLILFLLLSIVVLRCSQMIINKMLSESVAAS